jgi:hypothetical protein
MQESGRTTRRGILGMGALAVAGLAAAVGLGSLAERARSVPGAIVPGGPIQLHGSEWHLRSPDLRPGVLPERGDRVTISGVLSGSPGGAPIGTFFATSMHLDTVGAARYATAEMQMHTLQLPEGNLVGMGTTVAGEATYAVIGGTGRYLGATGSYTAAQQPFEVGGDGTAQITLNLKLAGEGH